MDVIQYQDPTGQTMVSRWPRERHGGASGSAASSSSRRASRRSSSATARRSTPSARGATRWRPRTFPILASVFGIPFGGKSPFQAAVFFVSTKTFMDLKWGTKEPVIFRDHELAMVRLRAFGKFAVRIANAQLFVNTVVGSRGIYSSQGVEDYFRDVIVARLTDVLGENLTSIFDLPKLYDELAMGLKARVADDFGKYGIELVDLFMGAITPPEEVQKIIDERSGMGAIGDMNNYMKFKTARAIGDAAQQPAAAAGGTVGAGLGIGMGAGLGAMLPGMMRDAMQGGGGPGPGAAPAPAAAAPRRRRARSPAGSASSRACSTRG